MAAKRDLEALHADYAGNSQASAAQAGIVSSYVDAMSDDSRLPALNQAIEGAPRELANVIPNAKRVLEQKQELEQHISPDTLTASMTGGMARLKVSSYLM